MKAKHVILILLTGGLAAAGYFAYKYFVKQKELLEDYAIALLKIKFATLSEDLAVIDITFRITNKAAIEATVEKVYADIYLNQVYACNVVNTESFVLPAKGSNDVNLRFTCANKELLKNLVSMLLTLLTTKDIPYRLDGSVKIKSGGLGFSKDFSFAGGIKSDML